MDKPHWKGLPLSEALIFDQTYGGVAVVTTAVKLLEADPYRVSVIISNLSTTAAFIGFDNKVSATNGLAINEYRESLLLNDDTAPGAAGRELWVISTGTGTNVGYFATRLIE